MKKTLIVLFVALFAFAGSTYAQSIVKLGHINSTDLMEIMPGRDSAQAVLQKEAQEAEEHITLMQQELETKYNRYQERQEGWSQQIRESEMNQIQDMNKRIMEYQQSAQKQLQDRNEELFKPIVDRAKAAIAEVAKENGYSYIFDSAVGALLYQEDSDDILPLVKKKLGLK